MEVFIVIGFFLAAAAAITACIAALTLIPVVKVTARILKNRSSKSSE